MLCKFKAHFLNVLEKIKLFMQIALKYNVLNFELKFLFDMFYEQYWNDQYHI